MRDDMFKVIVERPRLVNSNGYSRDGRKFRNHEEAPAILGMKRGYGWRKWLNENLAPLRRYLEKQVNRPWDKVYSEICATIDSRSTVKQHILQHIEDFVAIDTHWVATPEGGKITVRGRSWPRKDLTLEEVRVSLYVHPRTGILLRNRHCVTWDAQRRKERIARHEQQLAVRRDIGEHAQLCCIDGVWYHVTFGTLPEPKTRVCKIDGEWVQKIIHESCWDVLRKEWVSRKHGTEHAAKRCHCNQDRNDDPNRYAMAKRQLNSRELRKHGLAG